MTEERTLFDEGLQPERTELAWRRTALSIAVGSLVALRILPELLASVVWIWPGLAGLAFSAVLWTLSRRRGVWWTRSLLRGGQLPGAGLLLTLTLFTLGAGVLLVVIAVVLAAR